MKQVGGLKRCSKCKETKVVSLFSKSKHTVDGLSCACRVCRSREQREWGRRNPERMKNQLLKHRYMTRYGITIKVYEAMLEGQKGLCAICEMPESTVLGRGVKRLSVDHDHKTGAIRGLLCQKCNAGLGMFCVDENGADRLQKAVRYLND